MNREEFVREVKKLGIDINNEILNKLDIYCKFLMEYNSHTNLTAIKDEEDIYLKHFYDSLTICRVIDLNNEASLMDIGTGAGFPGMILKIFFPNLHVILVDSNNKKTKFLMELSQKIDAQNLEIINDRVENLLLNYINNIDVVTARAVTNLPVLTELAMPFVKKDKYFIAMKGNSSEELDNSMYAIECMNGELEKLDNFELYGNNGNRSLIKIKKLKNTDVKSVRTYEKIVKKPLVK